METCGGDAQQDEASRKKQEMQAIAMKVKKAKPRAKEVREVAPEVKKVITTGKGVNAEDREVTPEGKVDDSGDAGNDRSLPEDSSVKQSDQSQDKVIPLEIVKSAWARETRVIEILLNNSTENKLGSVFHIVIDESATPTQTRDSATISEPSTGNTEADESFSASAAIAEAASKAAEHQSLPEVVVFRELPANCPTWATRLKDCEEIGNSYRGFVESEVELDLLLTYHRQQTGTTWGTRQSPSTARESKRLMWKSNYVPYDGIPFLNIGSRAIVMECQFGPRRKGGSHRRAEGTKKAAKGSCTCPARIYVKKVRKFPDFRVDTSPNIDKMTVKRSMDKVFQIMKGVGVDEIQGVERFYVQLPTNQAHQYHSTSENQINRDPVVLDQTVKSRLHPELCEKIRELVSNGEINAYVIRQILRAHVMRTMFSGANIPERHNLYFFPTINDIRNHVLLAISAIEKGELEAVVPLTISDTRAITEPPPSSLTSGHLQPFGNQLWDSAEDQDNGKMKPASSGRQMWPADSSQPQTQSVTVTLTPNPDEGGSFISQVETQLSDGTTFISDSLTPETARLLSQINQHCQEVQETADDTLAMHPIVPDEPEELVQSESLLEEPKSITSGLGQSEEEIIVCEENDPTLSQSDSMMGLADTSSDDGNNQSETLMQTGDDSDQSHALLDSAPGADLSESEGLLHDATSVESMDKSKHLLDTVPTAIAQSDPLLQGSDEFDQSNPVLESSEALEESVLLTRTASQMNDRDHPMPLAKRARFEV